MLLILLLLLSIAFIVFATAWLKLHPFLALLITAFAFGIVHGFGLSFALRESFQYAGDHLITALLAFNIGVEIGQVLLLLALVPLLQAMFRYGVPERIGVIILSALVAHTGWHWMVERGAALSQFDWPELDASFLASAMRFLMLAVGIAGLLWVVGLYREKRKAASP